VLLSINLVRAQPAPQSDSTESTQKLQSDSTASELKPRPDSAESTQKLQSDSTASELKPQLDSAVSILKRTGKALKKKIKELSRILLDSAPPEKRPEHFEQEIRKKFIELTKDQKNVPIIKPWELLKILNDTSLILIDVRQSEEQDVSMLPGALSTFEFAKKIQSPSSLANKLIITYCTIGYRSGIYAEQLLALNISVKNLQGGLLAWSHLKGPLVCIGKNGQEKSTKEVHIYSKEWNYLHPDYTARW